MATVGRSLVRRLRASDRGKTISGFRAVDLIAFPSERVITPEGTMIAPAQIAHVGVQRYQLREFPMLRELLPNYSADDWINVLRPQDEVFAHDALKSFELKPLANDHPPDDITAGNWARMAAEGRVIGDVCDISHNDGYVTAKLHVRDANAIKKINDGKSQLSCGYAFDADLTPGEWNGIKYQLIQRNIRGNHVAIVDMARGGPGCRVGDRQPTKERTNKGKRHMEDTIETVPVTINGIQIFVAKDSLQNATSIKDGFDRHDAALKELKSAHKAVKDEMAAHKQRADAAQAELDKVKDMEPDEDEMEEEGESSDEKSARSKAGDSKLPASERASHRVAFLKARVKRVKAAKDSAVAAAVAAEKAKMPTDAAIAALAEELSTARAHAVTIVGDSFKSETKSASAIRSEVLAHVFANDAAVKEIVEPSLGGAALDKATPAQVSAAFSTLLAVKKAAGFGGTSTARDGGASNNAAYQTIARAGDSAGSNGGNAGAVADLRNPDAMSRSIHAPGARQHKGA